MKPVIGICANFSYDDNIGLSTRLGGRLQRWQLLADDYTRAVELAGGVPVIIPVFDDPANVDRVLELVDGVIFSGGNDIDPQYYGEHFHPEMGEVVPERDKQEIRLARQILSGTGIPFLAICRGMQLINVACGGTLHQNIIKHGNPGHFVISAPKYHTVHNVAVVENSRLNALVNQDLLSVNSYHHQAVRDIADCLVATATSPDGIVEAIEFKDDRFGLGVQWHPEMLVSHHREHLAIFSGLVAACSRS